MISHIIATYLVADLSFLVFIFIKNELYFHLYLVVTLLLDFVGIFLH